MKIKKKNILSINFICLSILEFDLPLLHLSFISTVQNDLQFGRNLDVTTYTDGKRETHNPAGRAHPQVVWDYYKASHSLLQGFLSIDPYKWDFHIYLSYYNLMPFYVVSVNHLNNHLTKNNY